MANTPEAPQTPVPQEGLTDEAAKALFARVLPKATPSDATIEKQVEKIKAIVEKESKLGNFPNIPMN